MDDQPVHDVTLNRDFPCGELIMHPGVQAVVEFISEKIPLAERIAVAQAAAAVMPLLWRGESSGAGWTQPPSSPLYIRLPGFCLTRHDKLPADVPL